MTDAEELREWLGKMLYWAKQYHPYRQDANQLRLNEIRKAEEVYKRTGK